MTPLDSMLTPEQAFQNAQLWKLVERERQKNAEMHAEREAARRRSATETQTPFAGEATRLDQSVSSTIRTISDDVEHADDNRKAKRQRANTVTAHKEGAVNRRAQPTRHHSEQHAQTEFRSTPDYQDSRHNPFMLKMSAPRSFEDGELPSPTTYSLPDQDVQNVLSLAKPVGSSSAPTSPVRRHSEGLQTVQMSPNEPAKDGAQRNRLGNNPGLLPSPPIGTLPSLGDRTLSEQTDSSLATPLSEEMPSVPRPSHHETAGTNAKETLSDDAIEDVNTLQPARITGPDAPLLTTAMLQYTRCSIPSARVMQNASGKEVMCFIVRVTLQNPVNGQMLSWSVGKMLSAFASLDIKIRSILGGKKEIRQAGIASLPESKSWKDFAPSKIDQRKVSPSKVVRTITHSLLRQC